MPLTGTPQPELFDGDRTLPVTSMLLGVQDRAVMDFMGWSSASMKLRYMHVTEGLRRDVADQLSGYFWKPE